VLEAEVLEAEVAAGEIEVEIDLAFFHSEDMLDNLYVLAKRNEIEDDILTLQQIK
ncbi:17701_t:CDS:2, partial [Entrophospora sp. SA101]